MVRRAPNEEIDAFAVFTVPHIVRGRTGTRRSSVARHLIATHLATTDMTVRSESRCYRAEFRTSTGESKRGVCSIVLMNRRSRSA
jgi:hypothetical protein